MKKRVVVLFGAGASTYSEPSGVAVPPLAKELYNVMLAGGFVPPGLPPKVVAEFVKPDGFETGMALLTTFGSMQFTAFLRNMFRPLQT